MRFNLLLSNSEQKLRIITAPLWANKRGHDNGAFGHFCIFAVFFRGLPLEFSASLSSDTKTYHCKKEM